MLVIQQFLRASFTSVPTVYDDSRLKCQRDFSLFALDDEVRETVLKNHRRVPRPDDPRHSWRPLWIHPSVVNVRRPTKRRFQPSTEAYICVCDRDFDIEHASA